MEWIFHIGLAQSLFSAFLLLTKRGNQLADKLLGSWMIFIFLELLHMLLEISHSSGHRFTSNFGFYSITFGPFLYLYVKKLTTENSHFQRKDLYHFFPYLILSLIHLIFYTNRPIVTGDIDVGLGWFMLTISRVVILIVSLSAYSYLAIRIIHKHKKAIKESFSFESSNITLNWLRHVTIIFMATYFVLVINMLTGNIAQETVNTSHYIPAFGLTFFCFSLSYYGFNQPLIFQKQLVIATKNTASGNGELTPGSRKAYRKKLEKYLNEKKPYLNAELNINTLASEMKLPRHYITEILKIDFKKNFFTFINDYRIEEVKNRLKSQEFKNDSVLQIAMQSGFNSKSSFNSLFKQHTGMTPSVFRKGINDGA